LVADGYCGKPNRVVVEDINVDVLLIRVHQVNFHYDKVNEETQRNENQNDPDEPKRLSSSIKFNHDHIKTG